MRRVRMIICQFVSLPRDGLSYFGATVADVHAIETSKAIDVTPSLCILDAYAFAACDDCGITDLTTGEVL